MDDGPDRTPARWPLRGGTGWEDIHPGSGRAMVKDVQAARIRGLTYSVDIEQISCRRTVFHRSILHINGWEYRISDTSAEYPILSLTVTDRRDPARADERFISDIRILSRPLAPGPQSARQVMSAALFLIRQIDAGQVPDVERVMHIYRIHPSQARLHPVSFRKASGLISADPS